MSGNVSLYNENNDLAVPPSALVSVFARVDDIKQVKPITWENAGAGIYYLGLERSSLAGSEFNRLFEVEDEALDEVDYDGFKNGHISIIVCFSGRRDSSGGASRGQAVSGER